MALDMALLLNTLNAILNFSAFLVSLLVRRKFAGTPYNSIFLPLAAAFLVATAYRVSLVAIPEEILLSSFLRLIASALFTLFTITAFAVLCRRGA